MASISNEMEFQKLMEEVDAEMISEGIPVSARELTASIKVGEKLGVSFPICGYGLVSRNPYEGVYSGYDLSLRIQKWFSDLYGNKSLVDFDIGVLAVEIAGEPYKMRLPMIYGDIILAIAPRTMGESGHQGTLNILDMVVDLTPSLAKKLSYNEGNELRANFILGLNVFSKIKNCKNGLLFKARSDLKAATSNLLHRPSDLGQARWSSLQAVEKVLKEYISRHGGDYPKGAKGHILKGLEKIAMNLGLPSVEKGLIDKVQCSPSVRYEEKEGSFSEAIEIQKVALKICWHVLSN